MPEQSGSRNLPAIQTTQPFGFVRAVFSAVLPASCVRNGEKFDFSVFLLTEAASCDIIYFLSLRIEGREGRKQEI